MPPQSANTTSHLTTFLIVSIFVVALFPSIFVGIFWAPYNSIAESQKSLTLPSRSRGSYLITDHILKELPEIKLYKTGLLNLFIQHTSCALSLNENWDQDVRADMSTALDRIVPEDKKGEGLYRHDAEGSDDMPAHVKSALIGASVTIPITNGKLSTGTWQGIWYLEFRDSKHTRKVVATLQGEKM
ncbi:secondary thiamine-phosphate synthase enzyme [Pyrenophora seminiperda CCB06]|uniref:Secondary thiamine-phosphate synthase enzyme n=1 Tax=Pyrenophora seminiperda CCB06 TaxID=1302712 RepID=A0A3M7M117_9PLEO|nr:secondary thiamine-phosphate synthase enzyme [Pyrenophora seminiperda CCB06]